jgi:UDP-N-acetylglucosamine--N-acetylmuramyl-(pentapeptide) pyrophosphoryl-undecaprenol N-acetylglucosamine transferase
MSKQVKLLVLAAGGTGGHVFPARALAAEIKSRGWYVAFITDVRGAAISSMEDIETFTVSAGGIAGKSIWGRLSSIVSLGIGMVQAWFILKRLKPDVVVGFGGYPSVPTMMAAKYGNYVMAIHEQNAVLGRANRLLASSVARIATSYNTMKAIPDHVTQSVTLTGMPVRQQVIDCRHTPYADINESGPLNLLVLGGSQGALVLSQIVPAAIAMLDDAMRRRVRVVQQCRVEDLENVRRAYEEIGVDAVLDTFIDDVPRRIVDAHLLIARAGASTVAECMVIGRPAILVPYPHAVDDHQSANAHAIASAGAGWIMDQSVFTAENLSLRLSELFGSVEILKAAAKCACKVGVADAASRLADLVEDLIEKTGERAA